MLRSRAAQYLLRVAFIAGAFFLAVILGAILFSVLTPQPLDPSAEFSPPRPVPATPTVAATATARPTARPTEVADGPTPNVTPVRSPTRPSPAPASPASPTGAVASPSPSATAEPIFHVVQPGEFVSSIADQYGVTVEAIVQENQLANPDRILVGQRLRIPPPN